MPPFTFGEEYLCSMDALLNHIRFCAADAVLA
jgi:hypothetical protein